MKILKFSLFFIILFSIACYAIEWDDGGLPGAFLEYGVSARVIGMGRAFTGLANDANAGYFNPG